MKKRLLFLLSMFVMAFIGGAVGAAAPAEDKALSARQESIVVISAFAAQGDLVNLKTALAEGLDNKVLTVNEEKELLTQLYAYAGFPRSLNALGTLMTLLNERKAAGIADAIGPDADPVDPNRDRYAIGDTIQTELVGQPVAGPLFDFAPTISQFLKEHLFCDVTGMHNGITGDQLKAMAELLSRRVGSATGDNAMTVAKRVLGE